MEIHLGFDEEKGIIFGGIPKREVCLTNFEEKFYNILLETLSDEVDISKISLQKNSDSYTSVCYKEGIGADFLRFKLTERTRWMSLSIANEDVDKYRDDLFFAAQKNKNQRHWRANLVNIDSFVPYKQLIVNSINEIIYWKSKE